LASHQLSSLTTRLEPFAPAIETRYGLFKQQLASIEQHEGGIVKFSEGYKSMGFQVDDQGGVRYKEWAPNAIAARLIGDFSEFFHSLADL
jgi:1,4-alpha-glucan branching enzyme